MERTMHLPRNLLMASLLCAASFTTQVRAETVNFTFLLTNDIYNIENDTERGGFARLNAVVKAERAKGGNVIYAHAGDLISPSLLSGLDQGEHTIALTNIAPPDIFTPGNHEFDFGEQMFRARMSEARFPLFAANLRDRSGQLLPGFKDTEIRDIGRLKVGFVGLTEEDSPTLSNPGDNLVFAPTFETALAHAKDLKAQGADMIVAVVHAERTIDLKLYDSGLFDLVLSGHDHDLILLYNGRTVLAESMTEANYVTAIDVMTDPLQVNVNLLALPGIREDYLTNYTAKKVRVNLQTRPFDLIIQVAERIPSSHTVNNTTLHRSLTRIRSNWMGGRSTFTTHRIFISLNLAIKPKGKRNQRVRIAPHLLALRLRHA
jgi:2',3'-cyclic-nucleotide 2'-phosphodiesterase (5'-nucleotidase family)